MKRRKPVRRFLLRHVAPPIATTLYRRLASSWNYVNLREEEFTHLVLGDRPIVGAFLHARTFQLLHYFSSPARGRWILMCSQSRDGEAMAQVEERLGFRVARGSSGKGGARALVEMIKAQRREPGLHSCLAIDGSRGPRGIAQLGIVTLAQKTGGLLLPVAASASSAWIWQKSWDRTVVPKRGAEVTILPGEPLEVPRDLDAAGIEALRCELERTLLAMHEKLDSCVGFVDPLPLRAVPVAAVAPAAS
ncbi:MAG TPA: lysophospholipid acyltransferase family protein [Steroidobacteraceae bacterium]|nr:lysophospholipid acyltransferase family protein [Steroidobacteraceae bacterium]